MNGIASLSLLPGTAQRRSPTTSPSSRPPIRLTPASASRRSSVTSGGSTVNVASAPTLITSCCRPDPSDGHRHGQQGYPVSNVSVAATPGLAAPGTCTAAPPRPATRRPIRMEVRAAARIRGLTNSTTIHRRDRPRRASPSRRRDRRADTRLRTTDLARWGAVQGSCPPGGAMPLSSATDPDSRAPLHRPGLRTAPWLRAETVTDGTANSRSWFHFAN